jgi:uncharacterized membrane protein
LTVLVSNFFDDRTLSSLYWGTGAGEVILIIFIIFISIVGLLVLLCLVIVIRLIVKKRKRSSNQKEETKSQSKFTTWDKEQEQIDSSEEDIPKK